MTSYVDTSALLKTLVEEAHSDDLVDHVQDDILLSSGVVVTELHRAAQRLGIDQRDVTTVLAGIDLVEVTPAVLLRAGMLPEPALRSLDAIHVASALVGGAVEFVTYDDRQAEAARTVGLRVVRPGLS
ncbi:MAG: type II toxin-antitoxin system VapC family toxin [Kribbellaceae bacterium]